MILDDRPLLHHNLVVDIVQLSDLVEHTSRIKSSAIWISTTLAETAKAKGTGQIRPSTTTSATALAFNDGKTPQEDEGP